MKRNRKYYSWSQHSLFLSSKREFHKRYVLGEPSLPNKYFEKGKELADYKETGLKPHYSKDPLLETVCEALPSLKIIEDKIEVPINRTDGTLESLLMYVDSSDGIGDIFYEYKTSKIPWNQIQVNEHKQLDFYAVGYYLKYGKIPDCKLFWIETEEVEIEGRQELRYTGQIESFDRSFTEDEIVKMMVEIIKTLDLIDDFKFEEIEIDNNLVERYIKLSAREKEIKDELNLIKLEVQTILDNEEAIYATSEKGRFTVSKRSNYTYSTSLTELKNRYSDEIKNLESKEKKDGKAKVSYTESLRFSLIKQNSNNN